MNITLYLTSQNNNNNNKFIILLSINISSRIIILFSYFQADTIIMCGNKYDDDEEKINGQ